jgi:hypothetical protein
MGLCDVMSDPPKLVLKMLCVQNLEEATWTKPCDCQLSVRIAIRKNAHGQEAKEHGDGALCGESGRSVQKIKGRCSIYLYVEQPAVRNSG